MSHYIKTSAASVSKRFGFVEAGEHVFPAAA